MRRYKEQIGPKVRRFRYDRAWARSEFAAKLQIANLDIVRSGVFEIEARMVFVDDRTLLYLAEVLKMEVQALFPKREAGHRLHAFMELLGKMRF